jgi:hypothetical protein
MRLGGPGRDWQKEASKRSLPELEKRVMAKPLLSALLLTILFALLLAVLSALLLALFSALFPASATAAEAVIQRRVPREVMSTISARDLSPNRYGKAAYCRPRAFFARINCADWRFGDQQS